MYGIYSPMRPSYWFVTGYSFLITSESEINQLLILRPRKLLWSSYFLNNFYAITVFLLGLQKVALAVFYSEHVRWGPGRLGNFVAFKKLNTQERSVQERPQGACFSGLVSHLFRARLTLPMCLSVVDEA